MVKMAKKYHVIMTNDKEMIDVESVITEMINVGNEITAMINGSIPPHHPLLVVWVAGIVIGKETIARREKKGNEEVVGINMEDIP